MFTSTLPKPLVDRNQPYLLKQHMDILNTYLNQVQNSGEEENNISEDLQLVIKVLQKLKISSSPLFHHSAVV